MSNSFASPWSTAYQTPLHCLAIWKIMINLVPYWVTISFFFFSLPWTNSPAIIIFTYVSMRTNFSREDREKNNLWLREYAYLKFYFVVIVVVQSLNYAQLFATPWTAAHQTSLSFTISQSLLKFMSIESVIPSNNLILCCPLLPLPAIFPINRVFFQWVSSLHQVAKVLELQLQSQSVQWIFRVNFL